MRENFEDWQYRLVRRVMAEFRTHGFHLVDLHQRNIDFTALSADAV